MKQILNPKILASCLIAAGAFAAGLGGHAKFNPSVFQQAVAASAQPVEVREDSAQLKADQVALQRQLKRLQTDQTRLKADTASGRMSAESKDAYTVYNAKLAVSGDAKDIAADTAGSLQMKADEAALQRQIKRLDVAIARNKTDYAEGRMAAESRDAEKLYQDQLAMKGEKKDVATDKAMVRADQANK